MFKPDSEYSIHPRVIVRKALELLLMRERKADIKKELSDLLDEL